MLSREGAGPEPRHPSQLYEFMLKGVVLFAVLWWFSVKPRPRMAASGLFLLFYGTFRFAVEFVRMPDAYLGTIAFDWLTMGQLLSLPMVVGGSVMLVHEWRGRPVWIIHRTPRMLESLAGIRPRLADPDSHASEQPAYATNRFRAREEHPEILVFISICTHLGCVPGYRPEADAGDLGSDWPGGFFCPCHGSRYDLAARVFRGQPAPSNMVVPPYLYVSDTRIVIGEDQDGG